MSDQQGTATQDQESQAKPASMEFKSRPRDDERLTRKPMEWWDRVKILLLLLGSWAVLLWATLARTPVLPFDVALRRTAVSNAWLLVLAGLEAIRQIHYLISERRAGYHRFWSKKVFGGINKRTAKMNAWNKFRVSRAAKWLFFLVILDLVIAKIFKLPAAIALFQLPILLVQALPFIFQMLFAFFFIILQFVGLFWFLSRGGIDVYMPDDVTARFTDVKGQDPVLTKVKENIIYLENPEAVEEKGGYVPGGILLWGPPGTGKTLMAQAVAGETNRPFVFVEPGAFTAMFMGVGILKVKGLYRKLRRLALRKGGVIVFFDEADALGNRGAAVQGGGGGWGFTPPAWNTGPGCNGLAYLSRQTVAGLFQGSLAPTVVPGTVGTRRNDVFVGGMAGGGGSGTLQALLEEMSGLKKPRGFFNRVLRRILGMRPKPPPKYRILHIFATNMPQSLDPAMLRPGRIDRIYKVGYPSKEGRKATFEKYLDEKKHELTPEEIDKLATITPYATGASIKDIVNEALAIAIRDGRETITWNDVIRAKQLSEHGPPDDTEYIERERHAVAIHEACHAVVAYRTRKDAVIDIATIERRGDVGGFVSFIPPEDQFVNWHSELQYDIMSSLASVAGERMFFGENSAGVAGDLQSATAVSLQMQAYLGMGSSLGSHYVTKFGITHGRAPYGAEDGTDRNVMETDIGKQVEGMLGTMYERTHNLLEENRAQILAVAHALEMHKTMSGEDVAAIIEGRQGPLVDGRHYETPEFAGELAAYHGEALAAHKEHARVKVPLPALPTPSANGPPGAGDGEVLKADAEVGRGQEEVSAGVGSHPERLPGDGDEPKAQPVERPGETPEPQS